MDDCRLLTVVKGLNRKVCDINGCGGQHSFLLHPDQSRASVNMFTVADEEEGDKPASEDDTEEEDDQSPRARLLRGLGIFLAEGPMQDDQPPEDDPEEPVETAAEQEATPEDVVKLEPEKEKKTPSRAEQDQLRALPSREHT